MRKNYRKSSECAYSWRTLADDGRVTRKSHDDERQQQAIMDFREQENMLYYMRSYTLILCPLYPLFYLLS